MSPIGTLFPFLGLFITAGLFIYFLIWNLEKTDQPKLAKKPIRRNNDTKPPTHIEQFVKQKENYEPSDIKEGFAASSVPSYPSWSRASIYFVNSVNDGAYKDFAAQNLQPSAEMISMVNSLPVSSPTVPNYGAQLGTFDAADITSIPWDADNTDYIQKDVVWGYISQSASASIFIKVYHRNLMSDPANIMETPAGLQYRSPLFTTSAYDPVTANLLITADAAAAMAGQNVLTSAFEDVNRYITGAGKEARFRAVDVLDANGKKVSTAWEEVVDNSRKIARPFGIEHEKYRDRENKLKDGIELDDLEKSEHEAYKKKFPGLYGKAARMYSKVTKPLRDFGSGVARVTGLKAANNGLKRMEAKISLFLRKTLFKVVQQLGKLVGISVSINGTFAILLGLCATPAIVVAAPMAAVWTAVVAAWNILDILCMALMITLQVILPTLFDKALLNGGLCPGNGKPLDQVISDEALYFIFTTFIPIGGVLDVFGPYLCYNSDGSSNLKKPLYIPPYLGDPSLSLYKHVFSPDKTPRGDSTSYTDANASVPPGWTITAGIARAPCDPGTWTSSPVDMLCNINTYVPQTYVKKSSVPSTVVKKSRIPKTEVKRTEILSTFKAPSGRTATLPLKEKCHEYAESRAFKAANGYDWRDDQISCWEDWKLSGGECTGGGCNSWWDGGCGWAGCVRTNCSQISCNPIKSTGCGCIRKNLFDRQYCPAGTEKSGALCYSNCPSGTKYRLPTDLLCIADCPAGSKAVGDLFCERSCPADANCVLGVAWYNCRSDQHDVGALCRDKCRQGEEEEVLGVCWSKCPAGTNDLGALCRYKCGGDTPNEVAGVCWGSCGDDTDVGALCRKKCRDGFHEVAGVCWGDKGTYVRDSMIPKSRKLYDPGYAPPTDKDSLKDDKGAAIPYCDYASTEMLNRMAQFYYDNSSLNPVKLDDGRITYHYIIGFYGVVASSEFSCDVACMIKTIKFDPVTGDRFESSDGANYPEDPGNRVSYRRFYFIKLETDPKGIFTVSGCTNADYTAPDAQVKSGDPGVDPIISVPKIFDVTDKATKMGTWDMNTFGVSLATTGAATAIGMSGGGSITGQFATAAAAGMSAQAIGKALQSAGAAAGSLGANLEMSIVGNQTDGFFVATNNDMYSINHGPIYEIRARDNTGVVPTINFCGKINTTELLCSHEFVLRDTIDKYHELNPTKRIKKVSIIEPRGSDGCYYKWSTLDYNPATNVEGIVNQETKEVAVTTTESEVVRKYKIVDKSTCVFTPTDVFITNMTGYPIRSYMDPILKRTIYPTRKETVVSTPQCRYIRIRPSLTAAGPLEISQIVVMDPTEQNISKGKSVYSTSRYSGADGTAAIGNTIVDGTISTRKGQTNVWRPSTMNKTTEYIDIDLGATYDIRSIYYYGRRDSPVDGNMGVRIQLLFTNGPTDTVVKELVTTTKDAVHELIAYVPGSEATTPQKPFDVPLPLPKEVTLGGVSCPTRCQDKQQVDDFVKQFNANTANTNTQILKVFKAVTPTTTRCDYEVEMLRTVDGKKSVAKEIILSSATLVSNTVGGGTIYGRYVRLLPAPNAVLCISQIVVNNAANTNLALRRPVYATSNHILSKTPSVSGIASLVTDGTASVRTSPNYWASDTSGGYIEVDLGQIQQITNVVMYGVAAKTYIGVKVEVRITNDNITSAVNTATLTTNNTQHTVGYNKCAFTYAPAPATFTGSFIQENTPALSAMDTSGGVLTFQSIGNSVSNFFNSIINPIKTTDPLGVLNTQVSAAEERAKGILKVAAANIQLQGCPTTKCSDPAVLSEIMKRYNADNSVVNSQFGGETNTMTAISKAGISGPNTCDVLFSNLYNLYDDFLYPPVDTNTSTVAKRFTVRNTGSCVMQVAPGPTSIVDISMNAIGLMSNTSPLTRPFSSSCQINCRDQTILTALKTKLNTDSARPNVIPNFTSVLQSFPNGTSTCEYMMTKDVTTRNTLTNSSSTQQGIQTYVRATFTPNLNTCSFALNTAGEFDPDLVTTTSDSVTGFVKTFINNVETTLPFLFNYDNTTKSRLVDESVKIL